ncbi:FecR family protein [Chitinophaga sp. 180180018-2]|nr:FecR family protein [Chitinophaga sp. 212800010-3]
MQYLLEQYMANRLSGEERTAFFDALENDPQREVLELTLQQMMEEAPVDLHYEQERWEKVVNTVIATPAKQPVRSHRVFKIWRMAAAAAVLVIALLAAWILRNHAGYSAGTEQESRELASHTQVNLHRPAPTLKLSDGTVLALDTAANGVLVKQGGAVVVKSSNTSLSYKGSDTDQSVNFNTLFTPRGCQYQVVLPDGTKVWLNTASSLRFPVAFTGNERTVELTGEGYFEVSTQPHQPFFVKVNNLRIAVLGTHFNIMAYTDETAIRTTLLEGGVRLTAASGEVTLKPGQLGALTKYGKLDVTTLTDPEAAIAWKEGSFRFDNNDIAGVLRQLSRWYDVEVIYTGKIPDWHITGKMEMNLTLPQVLQVLEQSGLKYHLEGKKLIVM